MVGPEGAGHRPADTRPLNVANADNRLLGNAVRACVEEPLSAAISDEQRGFVPGRSMLANILDVEEAMQLTALEHPRGAAWFFDFQAAFPSVAHRFLLRTLEAAGLPPWLLRFVHNLYENNRCTMVVGGQLHVGFAAKAGIRQGCPLSPILFAVAIDILLRKLRRRLPRLLPRAFADDIATVAPDFTEAAPVLHAMFQSFARISGLRLNLPKTVVMPLFREQPAEVLRQLLQAQPGWGGIRVADHAKYFGILHGPRP